MYYENEIDMTRRKYNSEEERKAARKAHKAAYYQKNKEKILEQHAEYRAKHKDEIAAKNAEYRAKHKDEIAAYMAEYYQNKKEKIVEYRAKHKDEIAAKNAAYYQNNKDEVRVKQAEYYKNNREKILKQSAEHYQNNREKIVEYRAEYRSTPFGRAKYLVSNYKRYDEENNRGECTIDAQWIVDNIFSGQCCHYCGESDWRKLGCDRIDNTKPHTPENVVCCCGECNLKKHTTPYDEFMRMCGIIGVH